MNAAPIALLGLRCAGKSTVGPLLARRLSRAFVDLDEEVLRFGGYAGNESSTPGDLLARIGLGRFRDLEAGVLKKLLEPSPTIVLATGGGVVERADSRAWLRRVATCVWLSVPVDVLQARLAGDATARPALGGRDPVSEVPALLARREGEYRKLARLVIEAGDRSADVLAEQIFTELTLDPQTPGQ